MTRPTTFRLDRILRSLGVKGGRFPALSDGPVIPVVIVSDFSASQAPEAVEARATWAAEGSDFGGGAKNPFTFYFWSLAEGGCVIERLNLVAFNINSNAVHAFDGTFDNHPIGSWLVHRTNRAPADFWIGTTDLGADQPIVFEYHGPPGPPWNRPLDLGGTPVVSNFSTSANDTGRPGVGVPNFDVYFDPWEWNFSKPGANPTEFPLILPPVSSLGENMRWYIPKGQGIMFLCSAIYPFGVSGPPPSVEVNFEMVWREVPSGLGAP